VCYDTMGQFGMNGSGVGMLGGGAANRISRRRVARRMPWSVSIVGHQLSVFRQSPRIRACTPRPHNVAEAPTTSTPARCAARRWAARSLAGHISTGSTRTRWPKSPRRENSVLVDPHPECEAGAGCALVAGRCTAVGLSCSSSSASMRPPFFTNITNTCKVRSATLGSTHRRWPHSSGSMALCEPKPPALVLHTAVATQIAVRCCSRCDLDAIPPLSCRGSD